MPAASLTIGVLSWRAYGTLLWTLNSYRAHGLLDYAPVMIFFQEMQEMERGLAARYGLTVLGAPSNVGIGRAFLALARACRTRNLLLLENDFALGEPRAVAARRLDEAQALLDDGAADVVRLRHRRRPGIPLHSAWLKGREVRGTTHLLDSVFWRARPDRDFPRRITRAGRWFVAKARYANYTNNPCMYRTAWFLKHLGPFCARGRDRELEDHVQPWWKRQDFRVAQGAGLFSHLRID